MIKGGKGGGNTRVGLKFEERVSIRKLFDKEKDFEVKGDELMYKDKKVAAFYSKHKLYKNLLEPNGINYEDYISKRLLPDDAILVEKNKTLFIIEIKFQNCEGSVDEKLQTCDFKNKQYHKLLSSLDIDVKYVYILNDWFKNEKYSDVLEYILESECYYFFENLPFKFLDLV